MLAPVANALWLASCVPEAFRFHAARRRVARAQEQVLADLLARNAETAFGRAHGFGEIASVDEFQDRVPLRSYGDLRPWLSRIEDGEQKVLTRDRVLLLEPTSGSSNEPKLIPVTRSLKEEFARAVAPWVCDLFNREPHLFRGRAYWSLSPVGARSRRTRGGVPIGFQEDAEYFGRSQAALVRALQAVPSEVGLVEDIVAFRYLTLLFLLRARDLALVSVWNPSFFSLLLDFLHEGDHAQALAHDIERGTISIPNVPQYLRGVFVSLNRASPRRAREVRASFENALAREVVHARLWPGLRLVSSWADAHAAGEASVLARSLPHARAQGKGLLATEGAISLPLLGRDGLPRAGAALAIRSHFFEFLPVALRAGQVEVEDSPVLAHEVEAGRKYSVVMTTGGGLCRYKLGDVVEVTGFVGKCPLVRFVGRGSRVSDLFGEKLHEEHVRGALDELLARHRVAVRFAMVAPERFAEAGGKYLRPAYTLFIESSAGDEALRALARDLEGALCQNFHYQYCRRLQQLGALRLFRVERGARESYLQRCVEMGQKWGDVKPCALHAQLGWAGAFQGRAL